MASVRGVTEGLSVKRVLCRISDKSRFSYDGLKRQRLVTPMLKDNKGELQPVDWEAALLTLAKVIRSAGDNYFQQIYPLRRILHN